MATRPDLSQPASRSPARPRDRVAIVAGLRTPFAKQGTALKDFTAQDLGRIVVAELVQRAELDPREIGLCVYGSAVPSVTAPNVARELVLAAGLPRAIEAFSVTRACATSIQAIVSASQAILEGQHDVAIAGGCDSASDVPITASRNLARALVEASRAKTLFEKAKIFSSLALVDFAPVPPALKEPSTGLTMGESAEKMAREAGISRADQDALAVRSHQRAAKAWADGHYADEVMAIASAPRFEAPFARDNLVRADASIEAMKKLRPVFDRAYGTLTAGNSSALTDGASAVLLMREDKAKALGYAPLGYLRSWAFAGVDPAEWMLMGPTHATPLALDRAGLTLKDIDLIDMHEAFAAQVLCNTRAFASKQYARERLGRDEAIGEVDEARLNVHGGSIALGHPFAATGARQVTTVLRALRRRGTQFGLITLCAAGGLGAAIVVEIDR
ncbi:MAG: acetyl-CoA C-acyltransferase FadI [Polyangiales bacterium]